MGIGRWNLMKPPTGAARAETVSGREGKGREGKGEWGVVRGMRGEGRECGEALLRLCRAVLMLLLLTCLPGPVARG